MATTPSRIGRCVAGLLTLALLPSVVSGNAPMGSLAHSMVLDADNKYHLAWDFDEENITFEVSVETLGYVGLGFSPNGGMAGSDIVIGWVDDSTGQGNLSDRHAIARSEPSEDRHDDYTLHYSHQNSTHTLLRFSRKLFLCGPEDRLLKEETVRLIWAYGDADPTSGTSIRYHGARRGNKNVYLLNAQRQPPPLPSNVITMDFRNQFTIPTDKTTYWCQAFPIPKLDRKHHIIKVEPIVQAGHESEVHHIILYGCYHPVSNDSLVQGHQCYSRNMPYDFWGCTSVVLAWAIGGGVQDFPENVGLPFGFEGDPTMLLMETHYDNPEQKQGLVDSSGFRITLTPDLRKYDAGILSTGSAVGPRQVIPPFAESFRTSAHCFPQCLSQAMEAQTDGIEVFGTMLHSHLLGRALRVRHFRSGIELPRIAEDDSYDFNYQYTRMLAEEISILPGDDLLIECDYNSTQRTTVTFGGLSTQEEMCLGFLLYYPRIKLANCHSSHHPQYLAAFLGAQLREDGTISSPPEYQGRRVYEVMYSEVDWTNKTVREEFQKLGTRKGVDGWSVECSDGKFNYPVHGNVVSLPAQYQTLPEGPTCGADQSRVTGLLLAFSVCFLFVT